MAIAQSTGIENIKQHGLAKLHSADANAATHVAYNTKSKMMIMQMKMCGGEAIKPPFEPYKSPTINGAWANIPEPPRAFLAMCKDSKLRNHIEEIYIYVVWAFEWTVNHITKHLTNEKDIFDVTNEMITSFEEPLRDATENYCTRPASEINTKDKHAATLERNFHAF